VTRSGSTTRRRIGPPQSAQSTSCERLSQRLEDLAEREGWSSNTEKLELLGRTIFGDLWEARPTPKPNSTACVSQPDHSV